MKARESFINEVTSYAVKNGFEGVNIDFEYMYKNRTKDMSLSELEKVLFRSKKNFFDHKSSVYSYISRLKNQIETDSATKIKIFPSSRGCYRMVVY